MLRCSPHGKKKYRRRNSNHLEDRCEANVEHRKKWHRLGILPPVINVHSPELKAHSKKNANTNRNTPCCTMRIRRSLCYPKDIPMESGECQVDHKHEKHVTRSRHLKADPEMLAEGLVASVERRLDILPEQMEEEAGYEERCEKR